jgi:hypothetical protein
MRVTHTWAFGLLVRVSSSRVTAAGQRRTFTGLPPPRAAPQLVFLSRCRGYPSHPGSGSVDVSNWKGVGAGTLDAPAV